MPRYDYSPIDAAADGAAVTLYVAPAPTVVGRVVVCNKSAAHRTYRLGVRRPTADVTSAEWLVFDASIEPNGFANVGLGVTLPTGAALDFAASGADVNAVVFREEQT